MLGLIGFLKKKLDLEGKLPDKWKDVYLPPHSPLISYAKDKQHTVTFKAGEYTDIYGKLFTLTKDVDRQIFAPTNNVFIDNKPTEKQDVVNSKGIVYLMVNLQYQTFMPYFCEENHKEETIQYIENNTKANHTIMKLGTYEQLRAFIIYGDAFMGTEDEVYFDAGSSQLKITYPN